MSETTKTDTAAIAGSDMLAEALSVEDCNRIIAYFMGWEKSIYENLPNKVYKENYTIGISIDQLNYNQDWNKLMEVVEKIHIQREVKEVSIKPGRTRIWLHQSFIQSPCLPQNNSITECWIACIKFIQWYNCQKAVS